MYPALLPIHVRRKQFTKNVPAELRNFLHVARDARAIDDARTEYTRRRVYLRKRGPCRQACRKVAIVHIGIILYSLLSARLAGARHTLYRLSKLGIVRTVKFKYLLFRASEAPRFHRNFDARLYDVTTCKTTYRVPG